MKTLFGDIEAHEPGDDFLSLTRDYRGRASSSPAAIVFPRDTTEVSRTISICANEGLAVVPQGGNTSLLMGTIPETDAPFILLNLARMNKVRKYLPNRGSITVEAGCILDDVEKIAFGGGELLGLSIGSSGSCQIGGVLATNAGGENVLRYGMARDQVLGVEAVFADGAVWSQLGQIVKNNGGYDIRHLLCGSEGTLGIITAAVLRLYPKPTSQACAIMHLTSISSLSPLLELARHTLGQRLHLFEIVNKFALDHAQRNSASSLGTNVTDWTIIIDVGSLDASAADLVSDLFERASHLGLVNDGVLSNSLEQRRRLLDLRVQIGDALPGIGRFFGLDTGVPTDSVAAFIESADNLLHVALPGAKPYVFGHAADGTIHYCAQVPICASRQALETAIASINALAVELGGSATAEHGIGRSNKQLLAARLSPAEIEISLKIKSALDPMAMFNPGAIFDATKLKNPRGKEHAHVI
jgi:FAD/FMN-containing dehydrogenase